MNGRRWSLPQANGDALAVLEVRSPVSLLLYSNFASCGKQLLPYLPPRVPDLDWSRFGRDRESGVFGPGRREHGL